MENNELERSAILGWFGYDYYRHLNLLHLKNKNMEKEKNNPYAIPIAIVIAGAMLSGSWLYISQNPPNKISGEKNQKIPTAQNWSVSERLMESGLKLSMMSAGNSRKNTKVYLLATIPTN